MTLLHQLDGILQQYNVSSGYSEDLNDPNYTLQQQHFIKDSIIIMVIHALHVGNFIRYMCATHIICKSFVLIYMQQSWDFIRQMVIVIATVTYVL